MWFQFQNVYFWQSVTFCFIQFWSNGIPLIDCLKTILVFCRARQTVSEYPIGRLHSFRSVWTNIHPSSSLNKNSHLSDDIHCDKKGPFLRFGSLLGPYINFRVPIFSVLATFTRRMSIQSACIKQWVNLICLWWVISCTVIIHIYCELMLQTFIIKVNGLVPDNTVDKFCIFSLLKC